MKKFLLATALFSVGATIAAPSFARDTREVTEVVGYVQTETTVSSRDVEFAKADKNGDGVMSFKEFADASMFENEYMMFKMNDADNDGVLSLDEFRKFSKHGPQRVDNSSSYTNYNFNRHPIY